MTRILPGVIAMAAVVVASNILVQFLLGDWLTWGAFTYPIAFLVTDVMNRVYGVQAARRVVLAGFVVGVVCSLIGSQIMLQGDGYEFAAVSLRVAVGSGIAFLTAQLLDVAIFNRLREGTWWRAPLASTLVGSAVDTLLFFSIAFSATLGAVFPDAANMETSWATEGVPFLGFGGVVPLWVSLAVADWGVKLLLALVALVPFRALVTKLSPQVA
ncbi:queuosine precursor transporter [Maritimibacter sp. DP1N21-5]|uniref:queuosine precursor transporter n=1 Tax=Maritimibacter sp. DP1N21-5 TaxID=2836867 RepID=UPI001C44BEFF|nr:queuosine precursor transporter [Maritimibacter sp. DP1N21-5]MBV7408291.1 queuosine precursor transporter [Maritimibacter sp. DP1N21-5]